MATDKNFQCGRCTPLCARGKLADHTTSDSWRVQPVLGRCHTAEPPAGLDSLRVQPALGRCHTAEPIIGMFFQDGLTGSAWGDRANYTASQLRGPESKLGVQAPVGFFDLAGLTADGSVENLQRRCQMELKHDRISMYATMGDITPEITGKLLGYVSPSADPAEKTRKHQEAQRGARQRKTGYDGLHRHVLSGWLDGERLG